MLSTMVTIIVDRSCMFWTTKLIRRVICIQRCLWSPIWWQLSSENHVNTFFPHLGMVNGLPLYNALLVFWPLKALYTTDQIHPIHTLTQTLMAGTDADGTAIRSNLGSSILPKDTPTCELEELGIEALIFLLVDDLFSLQRAKMRKFSANSHQRVDGVESTQKTLFNSFSVTVRDKRTKAACENAVKTFKMNIYQTQAYM